MPGAEADPGDRQLEATQSETTQLEALLLGAPRRWTRAEVAARAGVPEEETRRLWRALGFPAAEDGEAAFTDADVEAAGIAAELLGSELVDQGQAAAVTRALGLHLSRLAEWQVRLLRDRLPRQPSPLAPDRAELAVMTEKLLPAMERLQGYVWRRHLAAHAARLLGAGPGQQTRSQAVGFTDMVGFTGLTRRLDENSFVDLLERFESVAADTVSEHGGRIVKMIGDEVLFVVDDPEQAARTGLALGERAAALGGIPDLRTGIAYGPVLHRLGDVYGEVVNLAARLTSAARPGTVLADQRLARLLRGSGRGVEVRPLRPVAVRGYRRLRPYLLRRQT